MPYRPMGRTARAIVVCLRDRADATAREIASATGRKARSVQNTADALTRIGVLARTKRGRAYAYRLVQDDYLDALAPWASAPHAIRIARVAEVVATWPDLPIAAIAAVLGTDRQGVRGEVERHGGQIVALAEMASAPKRRIQQLRGYRSFKRGGSLMTVVLGPGALDAE